MTGLPCIGGLRGVCPPDHLTILSKGQGPSYPNWGAIVWPQVEVDGAVRQTAGPKGAFQPGRFVLVSCMAKHDPNLSLIFQALSDPTRRAMLAQIGRDVVPVTTLARPTGLALPTVMRHLAVLEAADLITSEKTGRTRYCRAVPETLEATMGWLATQRALWEARTDRLEDYVAKLMETGHER